VGTDSGTAESGIKRRREAARNEGNEEYRSKREALIEAAAAVFKERGYEATTLNDVAARIGSDRATLYYYVGSKRELFEETVLGAVKANLEELDRILELDLPPDEKLRCLVERLILSYEEHYPQLYVYMQEDMSRVDSEDSAWAKELEKVTRRWDTTTIRLISEAMDEGIFRNDIDPKLVANGLFGMLNWTHRWFAPRNGHKAAEIVEAFWTIFTEGVRTR
jgi:AcrR family transcriptional regulator